MVTDDYIKQNMLKELASSLSNCIYLLSKESWNYNEAVVPEEHRDMVVGVLNEWINKLEMGE
jgi:hypothetical protein